MLQGLVISTEETISRAALENSAAKIFPRGTVLVSIFATIGRTALLGLDAATNQAIAGLTPRDPRQLNPKYLRRFLDHIAPGLAKRARGVAQPNINSGILKELSIPVPLLAAQKRIVEVLDRADALRAKRRAALVQLDALADSIFRDLFGDPNSNSLGWRRMSLGELIVGGPQNGLYRPAADYGSGTRILRIDGFYNDSTIDFTTLKRVRAAAEEVRLYALRPKDIVLNRVNSLKFLGKVALIPELEETTLFESNMMRFAVAPDRLSPAYLAKFLRTPFVKAQILKAAKPAVNQASINQQDVRGLVVNVPPLETQNEFANRIVAIEKLKASYRASLAQLDALFASLQHRAFRGEL